MVKKILNIVFLPPIFAILSFLVTSKHSEENHQETGENTENADRKMETAEDEVQLHANDFRDDLDDIEL